MDLIKIISDGGMEQDFINKIVLPQGEDLGENNHNLGSQGNNNQRDPKPEEVGMMYVSKSLNTPRSRTKQSETPKGGKKKKDAAAAGASQAPVDKTAVFFISPLSDVKEEVLRYYEIPKE